MPGRGAAWQAHKNVIPALTLDNQLNNMYNAGILRERTSRRLFLTIQNATRCIPTQPDRSRLASFSSSHHITGVGMLGPF